MTLVDVSFLLVMGGLAGYCVCGAFFNLKRSRALMREAEQLRGSMQQSSPESALRTALVSAAAALQLVQRFAMDAYDAGGGPGGPRAMDAAAQGRYAIALGQAWATARFELERLQQLGVPPGSSEHHQAALRKFMAEILREFRP